MPLGFKTFTFTDYLFPLVAWLRPNFENLLADLEK